MAKPNPLTTQFSYSLFSLIENKIEKPIEIRLKLINEYSFEELKEQNFSQKLSFLVNKKIIKRRGINKGSRISVNYPGIIRFIFKEFFNYDEEDLAKLNLNDKLLNILLKEYLANSCWLPEEIKEAEEQKKNQEAIFDFDRWDIHNQSIIKLFENFILGFGYFEHIALLRETYYKEKTNPIKIADIETYKDFKENALFYYHKKANNPYTNYISEQIYLYEQCIKD